MNRRNLTRILRVSLALAILGLIAFWGITRPKSFTPAELQGLTGDAARGEIAFHLGGCASCHSAQGATGDELLKLGGGRRLASPFGTFVVPNISPDIETGIGRWTAIDLANAMKFGTSPDGSHYYPSFPYTSYQRVEIGQIFDLKAYLDTLPAVQRANEPHELPFPFTIRRGLGLWKLLYLKPGWILSDTGPDPLALQGRTMVEGLGHCGECHTPRGMFGNMLTSQWLAGAPNPTGKGRVPDLTPRKGGLEWSQADIASFLKTGFTPEFDSAGGSMAEVVENTGKLSDDDRAAIAAYLNALPKN